MAVGAQSAVSVYVTVKVMGAPSVTEPGVVVPSDSASSCDAPLQLAA